MKRLLLIPLGVLATIIGVIGIVIPVIPGFLFLLLAGLCFAIALPAVRAKLSRSPRFKRLFQRIDHSEHLPAASRLKFTFWALLEAAFPGNKAKHR